MVRFHLLPVIQRMLRLAIRLCTETYVILQGQPLKIQIVNEHSGNADFALSKEAFKLITGKSLSNKDRSGLYKSTVQILGCVS